MQSHSLRTSLRTVALLIVVGIGATARAERVDWSQYLEAPGTAKPMVIKHTSLPAATPAAAPAAAPAKKVAKPAAAKAAAPKRKSTPTGRPHKA
jgi:hypothetical protein